MYELYDYQTEMVSAILTAFNRPKPHPFIAVAATAAGKSLVIADLCHKLDEPVLILQPNKEILEQNYNKLLSYGITDIGMYSASVGEKKIAKFTFATVGSIKDYSLFKHFKVAVIDECHQVSPKNANGMYNKLFAELGIKRIVGLTATPYRLENTYAGDGNGGTIYTGSILMLNRISKRPFFKEIVYKVEMKDLIQRGRLTQPVYHTIDVGVEELVMKKSMTSYTDESLERWGDNKLNNLANIAYDLDKKHKRVLIFCSSLRQCGRAVELLKSMGIYAEVLDGETPKKQRADLIDRFQTGRLKWVVNVGTMTTGFDCPPLDCVVLLRPTMSLALYVQMLGRCVRLDPADPYKTAHFYDYTGTVDKFGRAEEIRLAKEDGYKDMLVGEYGRIDRMALFSFEVKKDQFKKKDLSFNDLMAMI